jgi:hypothetical protein
MPDRVFRGGRKSKHFNNALIAYCFSQPVAQSPILPAPKREAASDF